jgi:hypothetical protein
MLMPFNKSTKKERRGRQVMDGRRLDEAVDQYGAKIGQIDQQ